MVTTGVFFRIGDKGTCDIGDYWPGKLGKWGIAWFPGSG